VAFQPFASSATHESWIVPHAQQPSFGQTDDATLNELADILHEVLAALHHELNDPPYNLVVHSAPPEDEASRYVTWYVQIVPRLTTPAGFELATGIAVNPSLPEETAASLRAAVAGLRREPR
jgi:UDPglucose--hexose-1-phosphate uridylyltransferase